MLCRVVKRVFVSPACPFLPDATEEMDHQILKQLGERRDAEFYFAALCYGQHLWRCGHAGRALLALTRALYADVNGSEAILRDFPLPYRAMAWIIRNHSSDDFPGNPRISYQHQALRIQGGRQELRKARAWAVWALVCRVRPQLEGDASLPELSLDRIVAALDIHGIVGECAIWGSALREAGSFMDANSSRE